MKIWKYQLGASPKMITLLMPFGAVPLDAQMQDGEIVLWVMVATEPWPLVERSFMVAFTGQEIPHNTATWIATVQHDPSALVFHVLEVLN